MIHDLTNIEPLLHQYDPEKVLVGPLLNLWTNSSFRVFSIAGKGGKIHETIGLGFFELEIDAQRRRADIVAVLESCFGEVQIFDSQLEIAQMAHTLWANDETARFLATVSLESKPRPTRDTGQKQNLASPDKVNVLPSDLELSDTDTFANPGTIAGSGSNLEIVRNSAAAAGSSVSNKHRFWALSGVAAYLALCLVVGFLIGTAVFTRSTSMRQIANEAMLLLFGNAAPSITASNDMSQVTGTVTLPIPASAMGTANREAQATEAVRITLSSGVAGGDAGAAPLAKAQPSQDPSDQAGAAPGEQSPRAQGDQGDGTISLPQSSPSQTAKTQSSATETVSLSIPLPSEVAPAQPPASSQIMTGHDGSQLSPSEAAAPQVPEASSIAPQRDAPISAIVPLPRRRPVVNAVPSDRPRHRIAPLRDGARGPLSSLLGRI